MLICRRSSASNEKLNPKNKIIVGIISCLLGQQVRFDSGHKRLTFAVDDLSDYFEYQSVCPETGIGLPTPKPAL
ncbi:2-thiouracil desulfurase family protein [Providencia rettgeri]|uniref:2-thiouracil desulfurase family protein n=1 Tax=Providencia rettgeri TaxID=587 RepID=UPI003B5CF599